MQTRLPDLSAVTDADARRLLTAYLPVVRRVWATLYRRLPEDEALAVGTDAVLEAFLSCNLARSSESTWVRKVIHWRLAEAIKQMPWDRACVSLDVDPQVLNGKNPDEAYARTSAVAALTTLPINYQMVVDGHMRGESFSEVARSIGISPQRAHRVARRAWVLLRLELDPPAEEPT